MFCNHSLQKMAIKKPWVRGPEQRLFVKIILKNIHWEVMWLSKQINS